MTSNEQSGQRTEREELEEAMENTEPLIELGRGLVDAAISKAATESGRTPEEQEERMGDHFAYMAAEQNPHQKQLDDYELSGDAVEVKP